MKATSFKLLAGFPLLALAASCSKNNDSTPPPANNTVTIQNVLNAKPLVEYGTFANTAGKMAPLTLPGESLSFTFSATYGQYLAFATMYGWSNDLFFAPKGSGIVLFDTVKTSATYKMPLNNVDVSSQLGLWDNGTKVNQKISPSGPPPTAPNETTPQPIIELDGSTDAQGNAYLPASQLVNAVLTYNAQTYLFTLTIKNISGSTQNQTPLSPGTWAISYNTPGGLLSPNPIYKAGQPTANGLTNLSQMGDTTNLASYLKSQTGIFTPMSPVLVVVYNGIPNPIFTQGQKDAGNGLTNIAQMGDATKLSTYLKTVSGVKAVYVLGTSGTPPVLLPMIGTQPGSSVSQQLTVAKGDKIAIATMYGFSNDWFFATTGEIDATQKGDISGNVMLFDDGTAVNQFPGAGPNQGGTPIPQNNPIMAVPNPNAFTTLPSISNIIKVTLQ